MTTENLDTSVRPTCRFCGAALVTTFVDLGMHPICNSLVSEDQLQQAEVFYPLHAYVCRECFLVQLQEFVTPEGLFAEYSYFSSYSTSWVEHARVYAEMMIDRFGFDSGSRVFEIASNDGYLLQHFVARDVPVLGIEPALNVAEVAIARGIQTLSVFFGEARAREIAAGHGRPDLIVGNNVLAHVPDINDFVAGLQVLLKDTGVITMEFPHLLRLMEGNQFDTIYHEHFSYLSFTTVERIFAAHGLRLFDVEELPTHGGSLRIYACHAENQQLRTGQRVLELRQREEAMGFTDLATYTSFGERVKRTKRNILSFLIEAREAGKTIAGYGAPGKGNTLLNYCGIRRDLLDFTVDANPYKQGKYTPGMRIPIYSPSEIAERQPDYVMILPWNLREEISDLASYVRNWGGKFVVPIPEVEVW